MAIHFECPYCQKGCKASEESAGKVATCLQCNKKLIIPEKKTVLVPGKDGAPQAAGSNLQRKDEKKGGSQTPNEEVIMEIDPESETEPSEDVKREQDRQEAKTESTSKSKEQVNAFEAEVQKELEKG